jgi:hypothetical protein
VANELADPLTASPQLKDPAEASAVLFTGHLPEAQRFRAADA